MKGGTSSWLTQGIDEYDADDPYMYDDDMLPPPPDNKRLEPDSGMYHPAVMKRREENNDEEEEKKDKFQGYTFVVPRATVNEQRPPIPYEAQQAAAKLLIQLPKTLLSDTQRAMWLEELSLCPTDKTKVDPLVAVEAFDTQITETRFGRYEERRYGYEEMPLSWYLLACAMDLRWDLGVSEPMDAEKKERDQWQKLHKVASLVPMAPIPGRMDKANLLGISAAIENMLRGDPSKQLQVDGFMETLGPLSPADAFNDDFLMKSIETMRSVFGGSLTIVKPVVRNRPATSIRAE